MLVLLRDFEGYLTNISTTIGWVKDLVASESDFPQDYPALLSSLLIQSLLRSSQADLTAARPHYQQLLAPFVRLIASHLFLSRLPQYESLAEVVTDDYDHQTDATEQFFTDLRAVQDLHVSAQSFFGLNNANGNGRSSIIADLEYLRDRYEFVDQYRRSQIGYKASILSLEESRLGIQQNQTVKRLTQLAFIFIPLSFLTSVFGMNIDILTGDRAKRWTVIVGAVLVYLVVGISYTGVLKIERWRAWRKSPEDEEQKQQERRVLKDLQRTQRARFKDMVREDKRRNDRL